MTTLVKFTVSHNHPIVVACHANGTDNTEIIHRSEGTGGVGHEQKVYEGEKWISGNQVILIREKVGGEV